MEDLLQLGSGALKKAALNLEAKQYVLNNPLLYKTLRKAAERYIGGETLQETMEKVIPLNGLGIKTSIEFMGESTKTEQEATEATHEFQRIVSVINEKNLNSTIALDLSHIGLAVSRDLCLHNLDLICQSAQAHNIEVIVSAEGHDRTTEVIDTFLTIQKKYPATGITLQAYLHRTHDDFKELIKLPGRIRMVKGAFDAPAEVALPRGEALNRKYLQFVEELLTEGHLCSIATHDHYIQQASCKLIEKIRPNASLYEFESLYGIQAEQLHQLAADGHPIKWYLVYGKEWYLYLCNRIAEYPLNIFTAINDIVTT